MRKKIELNDTMLDIVTKMAEGNPGALSVLVEIIKRNDIIDNILSLDDMNIRGCQIWVGYKDYCNKDIEKFVSSIKNRDPLMVKTINKNSGIEEVAVTHGGSWRHI
jgi:hypothetical protein